MSPLLLSIGRSFLRMGLRGGLTGARLLHMFSSSPQPPKIRMSAKITGVERTLKALDKFQKDAVKAQNLAVRKETFNLMKVMKKEIKAGAPGGRRFAPLSSIARLSTSRRGYKKTPFGRMHYGVRYKFKGNYSSRRFQAKVGFLGGNRIQNLFQGLAEKHQSGFSKLITPKQRQFIIERGADLGTVEGGETPFFLKKSTRSFKTPARPIISPFWQAHQDSARKNIEKNFQRKMRGERI